MKIVYQCKALLTLVLLVITSTLTFSQPPEIIDRVNSEKSKPIVEYFSQCQFIESWDDVNLKGTIAPSVVEEMEDKDFIVDAYEIDGCIIDFEDDDVITAIFWQNELDYTHKVSFTVVKENGQWFIDPFSTELNDEYLTPWLFIDFDYDYDFEELNAAYDFIPPVVETETVSLNSDEIEGFDLLVENVNERPKKQKIAVLYDMLETMVNTLDTDTILKEYILPSFLEENNFYQPEVLVNAYTPDKFAITGEDGNELTALISDDDISWVHQLVFTVAEENGKWYISPIDNEIDTYGYFDPWSYVHSYIHTSEPETDYIEEEYVEEEYTEENFEDDIPVEEEKIIFEKRPKNKKEAAVYDFLKTMIRDKSPGQSLKEYISPEFLEKNNLTDNSTIVNHYTPVDFSILDREKNQVSSKIMGSDNFWAYTVIFDVVKEDGKWYVLPSDSNTDDNGYFNPWVSVETIETE